MQRGKFISSNQKHYADLGSDTSSVWIFRSRSSDVILLEVSSKNFGFFLRLHGTTIGGCPHADLEVRIKNHPAISEQHHNFFPQNNSKSLGENVMRIPHDHQRQNSFPCPINIKFSPVIGYGLKFVKM